MNLPGRTVNLLCLGTLLGIAGPSVGAAEPVRFWILPFDNITGDAADARYARIIPELLTVLVSQSTRAAIVDREHLEKVLAEQKLSEEGLVSPLHRIRTGKLLKATILLSGSFVKRGQELMVTVHATDIETARLVASETARGPAEDIAGLLNELQRRLLAELRQELSPVRAEQVDQTPIANFYFMRALNHYYAARYNHAIADFTRAGGEERLAAVARLWTANSYLAQEEYGHAYLELRKLARKRSRNPQTKEVERKLSLCEGHLTAEELTLYGQLLDLEACKR